MTGRGDLTEAEWRRLEPLLPTGNNRCGRWRDHRQVVNGILHRVRTGVQWRDLPERYGPWKTVYERHRRWSAVGINHVKVDALTVKQRKQIARQLMDLMFRSYFVTGRFHADPHPGNILISQDAIAHVIDWGMVGRLDRSTRMAMLGVLIGMMCNDAEALARQWIHMGAATPWSNIAGFVQDLSRKVPSWS
ncbi:transposase, partial [Streptomyces cyaneofuscatus]|uniref:transposase n=1 Tax=Streptomyces cyaneofuscatus TaxID=66883 RepID=UPI0033A8E510